MTSTDVTPAELERHRRELTGYCYRMLGSVHEAEDAVQDTFVRAWRAADRFEDRTDSGDGLRRWLYRIASNVCMDMLKGRTRRAMPMALVPADDGPRPVLGNPLPVGTWVEPAPDDLVLPLAGDPADQAVARESVRLAFVAALQLLAPRQRAILILRDVLRWKAGEVADLLDTTVHAVNSGLRRARAVVASAAPPAGASASGDVDAGLLTRYIDAFERLDMDALVALLHEDVTLDMPPYELWLRGVDAVRAWLVDSDACHHARFVSLSANAAPAVAIFDAADEPFAIQVFDVADGRIAAIHTFLDPTLFPRFGFQPSA
jgi:RNA polymerase sigma-70 factor (ECF subfamily)